MWQVEEINTFLMENKPSTGGAISTYNITVTEHDDGDHYIKARLPVWSQNNSVVSGVLKLALKALSHSRTRVYVRKNEIWIIFFLSVCDPD